MSTQTSGNSPNSGRALLELTIFGFLVSLALKASLDAVFGDTIPNVSTWRALLQTLNIPSSLLLCAFLATLIRFMYGAYRFHEDAQRASGVEEPWVRLWNIFAILILFVLFYITGLSIQHAEPFYFSLAAVHVWDFIWFLITRVFSNSVDVKLKGVMRNFMLIDVFTVIYLLAAWTIAGNHFWHVASIGVLLLAIMDFIWNRKFFFDPDHWRDA